MGALRVSFAFSLAVVVIAYGCVGESSVAPGSGAHTGVSANAGRVSMHAGEGGGSGEGGRREPGRGGRGGSSGAEAKGGAGGKGGGGSSSHGGNGGKGVAGKPAGGGSGNGGSGGKCETTDDLHQVGGNSGCDRDAVETCCTGDTSWPREEGYYDRDVPDCGEPRTCSAVVCLYDRQDTTETVGIGLKCCEDKRWHFVRGEYQLADPGYTYQGLYEVEPLSPPCGGATWPSESALHFDGAGYLELPTRGTARTPSVELWFRTTEPSGPLLSSATTTYALYLSGGRVCFFPDVAAEACTTAADYADGEWHHAAVTVDVFDGGLTALVVDGTIEQRMAVDVDVEITAFTAGRGRLGASSTLAYFTGELDEIRAWDDPRDRFQLLDYQRTRLVDPVIAWRLLGYWPLEESGSAEITANLAAPEKLVPSCEPGNPCPDEGASGAGGAPAARDGMLVDFDFSSSPWLDDGAF